MQRLDKDSLYWVVESEEELYIQKCLICGKTLEIRPHYWMGGISNIFLECPERHHLDKSTLDHTVKGLWLIKQVKEWALKKKK
jgi:hypothetical protein